MAEIKTDVLIVGGGPGGMLTGMTAAQYWPDKRITVVRLEEKALIPCGIPYIFGTLGGMDEDLLPGRAQLQAAGIGLLTGRVDAVDRKERVAVLENGDRISWERLVLGTGAKPFVPPIPGRDLKGVFTIHKEYSYLDRLFREVVPSLQRLAVIGGGFIGVEFAEEVRRHGADVHIIEMLPHLLMTVFDEEICVRVEEHLQGMGIHTHVGSEVEAILADASGKRVAGVRMKGGQEIAADAVLVAIGVRPRVDLAKSMGLTLSRHGAISVDGFQRTTDDPTIFAVGDCAQKQDFFTRQEGGALLASQAAAEGRLAGMNLYALQLLRYNAGNVAVYAGAVGDLAFGAAGLTATMARRAGFSITVGEANVLDHYPSTMPGTSKVHCRLIFSKESMQLLGGQVVGGPTTGELVNAIGIIIQARATATEIASFQMGMHPRLTSSAHPITEATGDALRRHFRSRAHGGA